MEIAIPAIIVIALLILTTLTLSEQFLTSQEAVAESWREMRERMEERARTDLSPVGAETTVLGEAVDITIRNEGDTKLVDFDQWDVILQYTGSDGYLHAEWYPFGSGWTESITDDELFEPGILNPGEEMVIRVFVSPTVGSSTTNQAIIATPNGISATTVFTH